MRQNIFIFCVKKLFLMFLMVAWYAGVAQPSVLSKPEFLLKKSQFVAVHLYTTGWGLGYQRNNFVNARTNRFVQCSFAAVFHPKEIKTYAAYSSQNRPYIYGKLTNFYEIQGGGGYQKLVFEKDDEKGVDLHVYFGGGISAGLLHPAYLKIATPTDNQPLLTEVVRYDPLVHFPDRIVGRADLGTGIGTIKPTAGVYAKGGFIFDAATDYERLMIFDIGMKAAYYPKAVQMMAYNPAQSLWLSAYICVGGGKRW